MKSEPDPANSTPEILFRGIGAGLDRTAVRKFALELRRKAAPDGCFTCLITTDRYLRNLNARFLGHDYPTDVLSFPSPSPGGALGEVAISLPRARAQASAYGHSTEQEVCILMLHGLLHLMGHDHELDNGSMRRAEAKLRQALGLPNSLLQRNRRR